MEKHSKGAYTSCTSVQLYDNVHFNDSIRQRLKMAYGYIVAQIKVTDPEQYKNYIALVLPTIEVFGGEFLARGGKSISYESETIGDRNVIIRFPSYDDAYNWYHSAEYKEAKQLRQSASVSIQNIVEGI